MCQTPEGQIGPVLDAHLAENPMEIFFDRPLGKVQLVGDLFIQLRFIYQLNDLLFAKSEILAGITGRCFRLLTGFTHVCLPGSLKDLPAAGTAFQDRHERSFTFLIH